MYITRVNIQNFGKFSDFQMSFDKGMNLIYGENEAGKTTLHTFIRVMLFGMERQRGKAALNDQFTRYEPWENPGYYAGTMDVICGGREYRLERVFDKAHKKFTVTEIATGRELNEEEQQQIIAGISEACYYNTLSVGQLGGQTDEQMQKILSNYAANLSSTRDAKMNMEHAVERLREQKKKVRAKIKNQSRQEFVRHDMEATEICRSSRRHQERLQMEEEDLVKELASAKDHAESLAEKEQEEREDAVRNQTNLFHVKEDIENRDGERNALLQTCEKLRKQKKEYSGKLEHYEIKNPDEIDHLEKAVKKERILPFVWIVILMLELAELLYAALVLKQLRTSIISGAVMAFTIVLGALIIKNRYKNKKDFLNDTDDMRKSYEETSELDKQLEESAARIAVLEEEIRNLRTQEKQLEAASKMPDVKAKKVELQQKVDEIVAKIQKNHFRYEQAKEAEIRVIREKEQIREKIRTYDKVVEQMEAIDLAIDNIEKIAQEISEDFGEELNQLTSRYLSVMTDGKYSKLYIDGKLDIKVQSGERMVPINRFSVGTIEQIYLSLRLAAARIMFETQVPVILDDAFDHYDDKRMGETIQFLAEQFEQCFVFTCHKREEEVARQMHIPYQMHRL